MEESWTAARSPLTKPSPGKTVAAVAALAEEAVVLTVAVAAATRLWPSVIAKQRGPDRGDRLRRGAGQDRARRPARDPARSDGKATGRDSRSRSRDGCSFHAGERTGQAGHHHSARNGARRDPADPWRGPASRQPGRTRGAPARADGRLRGRNPAFRAALFRSRK